MTIYIWRNQVKRNDMGVQTQYASYLIGQTEKGAPFLISEIGVYVPRFCIKCTVDVTSKSELVYEKAPEIIRDLLHVDYIVKIPHVLEFHEQGYYGGNGA